MRREDMRSELYKFSNPSLSPVEKSQSVSLALHLQSYIFKMNSIFCTSTVHRSLSYNYILQKNIGNPLFQYSKKLNIKTLLMFCLSFYYLYCILHVLLSISSFHEQKWVKCCKFLFLVHRMARSTSFQCLWNSFHNEYVHFLVMY